MIKRLQKRLRQIQLLKESGRPLNLEERVKVAEQPTVERDLAALLTPTSASSSGTPVCTPSARTGTPLSAAPTMPAACAAAACVSAQATLESLLAAPPSRMSTRATVDAVREQMAAERAAIDQARAAAQDTAQRAEEELLELLHAPLHSWDEDAFWQLATCEYALDHLYDVDSSPKQLQLSFRAACEMVRNPLHVPRLRGSTRIDALQDALHASERLRGELVNQLGVFKRFYCSMMTGFGRFQCVAPEPGESLLALMKRTHEDALKWRPPGRPPIEKLAQTSKENGRYTAEWRKDTYLQGHYDTGAKPVSLRGTVAVTKAGLRRDKQLLEGQKPAQEHYTTIRNHAYEVHHIQRAKALTNSFAVKRSALQWDEASMNSLSWCVIVLNCVRSEGIREREVLSTTKLKPDVDGHAKTGVNVGGAVMIAVDDFDVPVGNIDYCCTDTTSSNSSLNLPKHKGGHGGKGGSYAHLWAWFCTKGHILFFMIWCLSHLVSNEVKEVMQSFGACPKGQVRLRKKAKGGARAGPSQRNSKGGAARDDEGDEGDEGNQGDDDGEQVDSKPPEGSGAKPPKASMRWRLVEHLNDVVYAIKTTEGCLDYARDEEGLKTLAQPTYGVDTRWPYYIDASVGLAPATYRYDHFFAFLLHTWLVAEGHDGLDVVSAANEEHADEQIPRLCGAAVAEKISMIKHEARRQLLIEMTDPTLRIWLIVLACYGASSAKRFLNYTQNDRLGVAFKVTRIITSRIQWLNVAADPHKDPLAMPEFQALRDFVETRPAIYANKDEARSVIRKVAATAVYYFQGEKGEESLPRQQRALRWFNHPALLILGLMDEKGHAVETAKRVVKMATQGVAGIAEKMLPFMPDGLDSSTLQKAINDATDGVGVVFQAESLEVIRQFAQQPANIKLADVPEAQACAPASLWLTITLLPPHLTICDVRLAMHSLYTRTYCASAIT